MTAKTRIRLVHTSDTHLGDGWRTNRTEQAFARVIDAAQGLAADALLVVGDVFDHARVPDRVLEYYLAQVARLDCPVITLPGNHDLYHRDSLYRRAPFRDSPANFYLFTEASGQTISFPPLGLDLWGRAMTQHTPEFRPLAGMPDAGPGRWLVALAHGHFHFPEDKDLRSSPIWPDEVAAAPCHYLALGHWERYVEVSRGDTAAFYSGSPLGAAPDDAHLAVNLADLDPEAGVSVSQVVLPLDGAVSEDWIYDTKAAAGGHR